jgi:hypothetical protein
MNRCIQAKHQNTHLPLQLVSLPLPFPNDLPSNLGLALFLFLAFPPPIIPPLISHSDIVRAFLCFAAASSSCLSKEDQPVPTVQTTKKYTPLLPTLPFLLLRPLHRFPQPTLVITHLDALQPHLRLPPFLPFLDRVALRVGQS